MQRRSWGLVSLLAIMLAFSTASAQTDNVGYYVWESYDGEYTTYRLVHSLHVDGAENEPMLDGDIIVTWGGSEGGSCSDDPLSDPQLCSLVADEPSLDALSSGMFQTLDGDGDDEDAEEVPDRIRVIGWRIVSAVVLIRIGGGGGAAIAAFGFLRDIPILPDLEESAQACTAEMIGDMGGLLDTPEKQQMVVAYMNSQMAQNMWDESNYQPGVMTGRMEQVGVSYPDGTMERIATFNSSVCGAQIEAFPTLFDTGAILGHTHPMSRGETSNCEGTQGLTYGNRPSQKDVDFLNEKGADLGLIIDADGITIFTPDYDPDDGLDSPEVHHKGDHDGDEDARCGVTR